MTNLPTEAVTKPLAMADLATEMVEAAMAGQMAGLQVLLGEMQALAGVLPGLSAAAEPDLAAQKAAEAAVEMSFDNMPV